MYALIVLQRSVSEDDLHPEVRQAMLFSTVIFKLPVRKIALCHGSDASSCFADRLFC